MTDPFFSVLVTAYNRAESVARCVNSCQQQTFTDFEIVVVDDASTDGTEDVLRTYDEPRLRIVRHDRNRGISPARATAVEHARGEWFVMLDSDWELLPHSLDRLRSLIGDLPEGVRIIRSRLQWDDGSIGPEVMPSGITDYDGRLRWLEALALDGLPSDAGHCIHRSVFATTNYFDARRGAMEALWELELARTEQSLWVTDVLGLEHSDAPNSHSRDADAGQIPRLMDEARDSLWMAETMLAEHGEELARLAPHYRSWVMDSAVGGAFLAGERLRGIRHTWTAVRAGDLSARLFATLVLGVLGPRAVAHAKVRRRRIRAWLPAAH